MNYKYETSAKPHIDEDGRIINITH